MDRVYSPDLLHGLFSRWLGSIPYPGNNQAMKFTAAMAMPTPKRTPASTRFEPPSPKAKVKPASTIATRERPRAIVLVNACMRTLTAFSQGEPVCANKGATRIRPAARTARFRAVYLSPAEVSESFFIVVLLLLWTLGGESLGEFSRVPAAGESNQRH